MKRKDKYVKTGKKGRVKGNSMFSFMINGIKAINRLFKSLK